MTNVYECILNAEDIEVVDNKNLLIVNKEKNILLTGLTLDSIEKCYEIFGNKFRKHKENSRNYPKVLWTYDEIKYLKENYLKEEFDEICLKINKSNYQVNLMLGKLGLITKRGWTEEEVEFLKNNIKNSTVWLAGELKRSVASIKAKKRILKLLGE